MRAKSKSKLTLDDLKFPSYEEIMKKISKKLGLRPELPDDLSKGVWSEQSLKVLQERYLRKDKDGAVTETPEELCWRVAWEIASAEAGWGKTRKEVMNIAKDYYNILVNHEFLPNSPTLMNAGTGNNLQYSACFVIPVEDSIEGIFDALKYQALIHKTGGGTGFSFSRLRPRGSMVKTSSGTASGPVSFMRIFDAATNEIKQGGKRRGANMGVLRVDHPDILEFIHCKEEGGITNFNISVGITDKFMEAYKEGKDYKLIDPKTKEVSGKLSAKLVLDEIVKSAWRTGDPGVIFIDRMNRGASNPVPLLGPIESTNPCGEVPLYPFDSCNLGSIFLNYFVRKDPETGSGSVDWEKLEKVTRMAVRFLDDVIEVNPYTLPQIRQTSLAVRRIGLGVGGWADLLVELGIPYDSDEALSLAEKLMDFVNEKAKEESCKLAQERGPFPLWQESIYKDEKPRRNSTVTTIAPTGSISIIANASSGIEPLFAIAYRHIVKDKNLDRTLTFFNPRFERLAKEYGVWDKIKGEVAEKGTVRGLDGLPDGLKDIFATAHEIAPEWHIKMQAAFQKHTDNAVSKTINLERTAEVSDVSEAYLKAWETGCKGITVFRDGCKDKQVLNLGIKNEKEKEAKNGEVTLARPFKVAGATYKLVTPVGTAFITINEDEQGEPLELFINIGKAGSDLTAIAEALGRTISTALRFKGYLSPKDRAKEIAFQLGGIGGRRSVGFGHSKIRSLPDAVSVALSTHFGFGSNHVSEAYSTSTNLTSNQNHSDSSRLPNGHSNLKVGASVAAIDADPILASTYQEGDARVIYSSEHNRPLLDICPSCGANAFVYEEGCSKCQICGYSEC